MNSSQSSNANSITIVTTPSCPVILSGINEFIPLCNEEIKPKLHQVFQTLKEAEDFYENYAKVCGFEPRLSTTKLPTRGAPGEYKLRNVLCNRTGFRELPKEKNVTGEGSSMSQTRTRMITRVGCPTRIQFTRQENKTYKVNKFHEGHNHITTSPNSMMFLKGNKNMTSVQKNFVAKAARLKLGGVKVFRGWKELSGGYNNVGASEIDFKNFVRDMKKYIGDFDGQMFIENFMKKKEMCKTFYFNFQVDDNNRLCRVFLPDTINIKNYLLFGDTMSVDSTYRTNKYNMVFVPFTGVDHHKRCVNFGAGLLAHEDIDSSEWLFNSFLEAMEGHQPKVIITDQDPAMKIAITEIFTEASHRLCIWHIMKKLREKIDAYLWQDVDFKKRLNCCVWSNNLDANEFEEAWSNIMIDYDLIYHPWFTLLFEMREEWIPTYFKDIFMGGLMRVTSRSESENNFFDRFVTPHVSLVEFWMCYESAIDAQRHKQLKLNHDNKQTHAPLKTPLPLEKHGAETYTHNIFNDFQTELCAALYNCGLDDLRKNNDTEVYTISDTEREGKS
ncbi:hypothetical protein RND81_08G119100 [Saponaria officinalis]|uniref:Protein FAR1-RELATED SEQUENCE n=1 Tax=Saponaria officinalis TaxID=3572 RepID=A0AAW1J7S8_SAPOF